MIPFFAMIACSEPPAGTDSTAPPATSPSDAFDGAVTSLQADTARHGDGVLGSLARGAIEDFEEDFWVACQGYWGTMDRCMGSFMGCGMMGGGSSWDDWSSWMDDLWDAMEDHHDVMGTCASVPECHELELGWQEHMDGLFDHMDDFDRSWSDGCRW